MSIHTPDWVKDAIFYQIFPDRFAMSEHVPKPPHLEPWDDPPTIHGFKGGDLLGVLEHLDYLSDLGITAIYFNPIFCSTANHRYHTYDYLHVDPLLGGDEAFRRLLDAAHRRGMRIILDGVFNHASRGFYQFNHILENGPQSPYLDWFIIRGFPLHAYDSMHEPNYVAWWNMPALPKLNTDNPEVREFLMEVAEYWIRQGIDGWRLDVPLEITTPGFWEEFRRRVKALNPEAYILGEIWDGAQAWLQGERFDAIMNYSFNRACYGFFGGQWLDVSQRPGGFSLERLDGVQFSQRIDYLLGLYDWQITSAQYNLLSSHDEPRFLTMVHGDTRRLRLATLFQMTFPGAPSIYYGDEVGMEGGRDPDCRRGFPWDESRWDHALRSDFRRCIQLRKDHVALRRGSYQALAADASTYVFARVHEGEVVVVAFNVGDAEAEVTVDLAGLLPAQAILHEVWTHRSLTPTEGKLSLTLPALDGRVFVWQANR
ncbi:MAG TPA: alpha-amylase [Chloroflexi bacterium]|nr:alpha-amylase [Chloroflexota bacterium]